MIAHNVFERSPLQEHPDASTDTKTNLSGLYDPSTGMPLRIMLLRMATNKLSHRLESSPSNQNHKQHTCSPPTNLRLSAAPVRRDYVTSLLAQRTSFHLLNTKSRCFTMLSMASAPDQGYTWKLPHVTLACSTRAKHLSNFDSAQSTSSTNKKDSKNTM